MSGHKLVAYSGALKAPAIRAFLKGFGESDWADWGALRPDSKSAKKDKQPEEPLHVLTATALADELGRIGTRQLVVLFGPVSGAVIHSSSKSSRGLTGVCVTGSGDGGACAHGRIAARSDRHCTHRARRGTTLPVVTPFIPWC
jgi:hypothetical protein